MMAIPGSIHIACFCFRFTKIVDKTKHIFYRNIINLANEEWNLYVMFMIASSTEWVFSSAYFHHSVSKIYVIFEIVRLPADLLLIVTLDRFGRRWLAFASLVLSGAFSLISATIPEESN